MNGAWIVALALSLILTLIVWGTFRLRACRMCSGTGKWCSNACHICEGSGKFRV